MKILIDTHAFLWFVSDASQLSDLAKAVIEDDDNEVYLSIASLWEISIKSGLKKLRINGGYASVINDVYSNSITLLPIEFSHTLEQNKLPFHHRDPFDRMIVS